MKTVLTPVRLLAILAGLSLLLPFPGLSTAKPTGGDPVPAGKLFFLKSGFVYSMTADGKNQQQIDPALSQVAAAMPLSSQAYGGSHWQLMVAETDDVFWAYRPATGEVTSFYGREVFAYRWYNGSWQTVQVTNMSKDGYRSFGAQAPVAWSGDGQDSFLSVQAGKFNLTTDGDYVVTDERVQHIVRLQISGADLEAYASVSANPDLEAADPRFEDLAAEIATVYNYETVFSWHAWNPDGTKLLTVEPDGSGGSLLYVRSLSDFTKLPLVSSPFAIKHPRWSPVANKILFEDDSSVRIVNSDGSGLTTLRAKSTKGWGIGYFEPNWSPDGQWISYRKADATKSVTSLCRLPLAGGTEVAMTSSGADALLLWATN